MAERRVVITGLGAITPLGNSVAALWDGLVSGRCGIAALTRFDSSPFDVHIGGECLGFDPEPWIDKRMAKRMDRHTHFGVAGAVQAFDDAGLKPGQFHPERAGCVLGTGIGGMLEIEEQVDRLNSKGPSKVSAFTIPKLMANATTGHVSIRFGLHGVSAAIATACASAGNAMCDAYRAIRSGEADVMVTGGTEAALTRLGLAAFCAMRALSVRNDAPQLASRPFDKDRDGFVMSEGSGILLFESYDFARARGARIYAEVIGVGESSDAFDMVAPEPEGRGAVLAMRRALASARINPDEIDYVNAHATSTPIGDVIETRAIKAVFGDHARRVPISSTKGATGHLLGATGGIEMIACVLAIQNKVVPPTINLDHPDPECDLDYVPKHARDARVRTVMNNSFGFGGHNVSLIVRGV